MDISRSGFGQKIEDLAAGKDAEKGADAAPVHQPCHNLFDLFQQGGVLHIGMAQVEEHFSKIVLLGVFAETDVFSICQGLEQRVKAALGHIQRSGNFGKPKSLEIVVG